VYGKDSLLRNYSMKSRKMICIFVRRVAALLLVVVNPFCRNKDILLFKKICTDNGKHWKINIESSLNVQETYVNATEVIIDNWIVDIKDMNPEIYRAYTGRSNDLVIKNLQHLINKKAKITVRVPLIPKFNTESDVENNIKALHKLGVQI
jgi:pyruvate formate lyase activating enzyme